MALKISIYTHSHFHSTLVLPFQTISTQKLCEIKKYHECATTYQRRGIIKVEGGADSIYPRDMVGRKGVYNNWL